MLKGYVKKTTKRRKREIIVPISELLNKPYLNELEVSALTGRAVSTLRNDRHLRRGFPYTRIGLRGILYRTADVVGQTEARLVTFF
jgi:hypothetical protein